jgi:hypothetical protein
MPVKMSREQLEFWRELLAPFPGDALSVKKMGGTELTYIDKRSLANRLDSIVGPTGWYPEYRDAGGRGLICKLFLYVPMPDGTWAWMSKEDGGSDEGMTKKVGGQQVEDTDNSFKSELTNAFRRAAQDAWGIGRYLYQKGIPIFLDPSIPAESICGEVAPANSVHGVAQTIAHADREIPKEKGERDRTARAKVAAPAPAVERINLPPAGRDVYAWVRNMESRFRTSLLNRIKEATSIRGLDPTRMSAWPKPMVNEICGEAIVFIKELATYRGEFDHIRTQTPPWMASAAEPPTSGMG